MKRKPNSKKNCLVYLKFEWIILWAFIEHFDVVFLDTNDGLKFLFFFKSTELIWKFKIYLSLRALFLLTSFILLFSSCIFSTLHFLAFTLLISVSVFMNYPGCLPVLSLSSFSSNSSGSSLELVKIPALKVCLWTTTSIHLSHCYSYRACSSLSLNSLLFLISYPSNALLLTQVLLLLLCIIRINALGCHTETPSFTLRLMGFAHSQFFWWITKSAFSAVTSGSWVFLEMVPWQILAKHSKRKLIDSLNVLKEPHPIWWLVYLLLIL